MSASLSPPSSPPPQPPSPEWDLLLSFAHKNRPDKIRDLIVTAGAPPNHSNAIGQTALHIAALWGHYDSAQVLLDVGGANPNVQNKMGATPLHMVAQSSKATLSDTLRMIDLLVSYGADLSVPDNLGRCPCSCVIEDGTSSKRPIVEKLQPRQPPIMEAIRAANERKVRELLEDINQDDNDDASPLALQSAPALSVDVNQIYMGRTPVLHVVDRIIQRLGENDPETPDHVAALVSILRLLVDNGGRLPLEGSIATSVEDVPVLSRLFEGLRVAYVTFADPNPSSSSSRSQSVPSTLEGAIKLLVDSLDVPLTQDCCEHLHQAARRGDVHMMTFMVEQLHLDPNMPGRQGMTPLMHAARSGQLSTLQYLLRLDGIDVTATDMRGRTALDAAKANDREDIVAALEDHIADRRA